MNMHSWHVVQEVIVKSKNRIVRVKDEIITYRGDREISEEMSYEVEHPEQLRSTRPRLEPKVREKEEWSQAHSLVMNICP